MDFPFIENKVRILDDLRPDDAEEIINKTLSELSSERFITVEKVNISYDGQLDRVFCSIWYNQGSW